MNPFDLRGPEFLAFYLFATGAGLLFLYLVSRGLFSESSHLPSGAARRHLRDPYLLAYLRGGVPETLLTVAFSLNKRKLLTAAGPNLLANRSKEAMQAVRNPLELAMMAQCSTLQSVTEVLRNGRLESAVENYAEPLRESGLVANEAELARRRPALLCIGGTLLALGAIKILVALHRGHTNVLFLIILTAFALFAAYAIFKRRRTSAGDRALADQQTLFARLRSRVNRLAADDATDEAVLVAAAFGLAALPTTAYPFAARIKRQIQDNSSSNSSSSCGSGGGSSCGGGGGCGGCGS
jgi:uncharacterized protein (TIGR04222 family)